MAGTRFVEESDEDIDAFFLTSKKHDKYINKKQR